MKSYLVITLMIVAGVFTSCGKGSSGTDTALPRQDKVQLMGSLPRSLSVDSTFSDTLEFVNGKVGNADFGDNKPEWIKVKTNSNEKQIIVYGETPSEPNSQKLMLNINGDPATSGKSSFGLSFTLTVIK